MKNLFHPEDLKIDRQLQEETNPVSETAKMTLFQLAEDGDREAAAIAGKLGLTFEGTQTSGSDRMTPEDIVAFRIVLEVRYRTVEYLAETADCGTVADLPCGYTPLAIAIARKGKNYLGLDLPAVITEVKDIILPMIGEKNRTAVRFAAVDATNGESMEAAFLQADGSLCIITAGLLMYLSDPEIEAMLRNIKKVLDEYGGCWITPDPEVEVQHFSIMKAISGDRFDRIMQERHHVIQEKSDTLLGQNTLTVHLQSGKKDMEKAMAFLKSQGLHAERLIVSDYLQKDPSSFSLVDEGLREEVRKVFRETALWKITSEGPAGPKKDRAGKEPAGKPGFNIRASRKGDLLELELTGNLDMLSAPELLAFYEKESADHDIRKVTVDCTGLRFISSAGLRVLLKIKKDCSDGVTLNGMNELVREIIEKTGFNQVLADASPLSRARES